MAKDDDRTQMPDLNYVSTDRYMCEVLDEMRRACKTLNFGGLLGMIEEAQALANRMESAISLQKDVKHLHEDVHNLKQARKALKAEVKKLIDKRDNLSPKKKKKK